MKNDPKVETVRAIYALRLDATEGMRDRILKVLARHFQRSDPRTQTGVKVS